VDEKGFVVDPSWESPQPYRITLIVNRVTWFIVRFKVHNSTNVNGLAVTNKKVKKKNCAEFVHHRQIMIDKTTYIHVQYHPSVDLIAERDCVWTVERLVSECS
jgi:hypothetical protein